MWLEKLIEAHLPPVSEGGTALSDTAGPELADGNVVHTVCHLRLIKSIRSSLLRADLPFPIQGDMSRGVDHEAAPANAKLELIRFWRESREPGQPGRVRARLDCV